MRGHMWLNKVASVLGPKIYKYIHNGYYYMRGIIVASKATQSYIILWYFRLAITHFRMFAAIS